MNTKLYQNKIKWTNFLTFFLIIKLIVISPNISKYANYYQSNFIKNIYNIIGFQKKMLSNRYSFVINW